MENVRALVEAASDNDDEDDDDRVEEGIGAGDEVRTEERSDWRV